MRFEHLEILIVIKNLSLKWGRFHTARDVRYRTDLQPTARIPCCHKFRHHACNTLLVQPMPVQSFGLPSVNTPCAMNLTKTAIPISTCLIQVKARWRSPPKMDSQHSHLV